MKFELNAEFRGIKSIVNPRTNKTFHICLLEKDMENLNLYVPDTLVSSFSSLKKGESKLFLFDFINNNLYLRGYR